MFGKKKSEIEFKGVSVSNEKRNAIVLFAAEAVIVLVFIVGVVFALNYFGIINLVSIIQNVQDKARQNPKEDTDQLVGGYRTVSAKNTRNTETARVQPSISVVSDIQGITIEETGDKRLLEFINSYGVFGKKYLLEPGKFSDFIDEMEVHLTDIVQPSNKYFLIDTKIPATSSSIQFQGGKLTMKIHLSEEAYSSQKTTPEQFFMQSLLTNIFQMAKDPSGIGLSKEQQKELQDEINKAYSEKTEYIQITKN